MQQIKQRRFNFFDKEIVKDPNDQTKNFEGLKEQDIKLITSGRGLVICSTANGTVLIINKLLTTISFKPFEFEIHSLNQFKNSDILLAAGTSEMQPSIKIFKLDKLESNGSPTCVRTITITSEKPDLRVTCMAVYEAANSIIVGCSDGSVIFYKNDILKDRNLKSRVIHQAPHPITGLAFKELGTKILVVFVATEFSILTVSIGSKDKDEKRVLSASEGSIMNCSTITDQSFDYQFVVARKDAVYVYDYDVLGACYPFEGDKVSVHWFRGKVIIVSKESAQTIQKTASTVGSTLDMTTISVYDVENRYVGFSGTFSQVTGVFCEWGSVYVIASNGKQLFQLTEKDTQSKLQILFKKNLYQMAIDLAKSHQYDAEGLNNIIRQYADHLYLKGDYDKSIAQYIKTIGHLEPSYIIRKYLDSQRIINLTEYLQELHKAKLANEDHTTLLLNCYTKLKDEIKLNTFLMTENIDFDIDTAIKVLRQSGYYKQALTLSEKHQKHDDYLKIQLENLKNYSDAIEYIEKLDSYSAIENFKKYGKLMLLNIPDKAVDLLKKICSKVDPNTNNYIADFNEFLHLFLNNSNQLIEFLEYIVKNKLTNSQKIYNTLIELYVTNHMQLNPIVKEKQIMDFLSTYDTLYDINQALVICQLYNFKAGILYLYEKNEMYQRILQYHMDNKDYDMILNTCKKHYTKDFNLWIHALQYFSKWEDVRCKEYIIEIVAYIDNYNLLPPLMVIKILSQNNSLTLDSVKDYLLKRLRKVEKEIDDNTEAVNKSTKVSLDEKNKINHLKFSPLTFQANRCEYCHNELDFPSIHCLCLHSFHQECFENHSVDDRCPTCAIENSNLINLINQNQDSTTNLHESFHKQLERSADKYEVIAEFMGKGLFNKHNIIAANAFTASNTALTSKKY